MTDVSQIIARIESGDRAASDELLPLVYQELRKLAEAKLAHEKPGQTLQATALVHEAYVRLVDQAEPQKWDGRGHFFAAAAEAMRRILVDRARRKQAQKHGGLFIRVGLENMELANESDDEQMLALDEALRKLERHDPMKAELVKLRYFAGLTNAQAAEALGIGVSTAIKYWSYARCWLRAEINDQEPGDEARAE